jgi:hypothetical protein
MNHKFAVPVPFARKREQETVQRLRDSVAKKQKHAKMLVDQLYLAIGQAKKPSLLKRWRVWLSLSTHEPVGVGKPDLYFWERAIDALDFDNWDLFGDHRSHPPAVSLLDMTDETVNLKYDEFYRAFTELASAWYEFCSHSELLERLEALPDDAYYFTN